MKPSLHEIDRFQFLDVFPDDLQGIKITAKEITMKHGKTHEMIFYLLTQRNI